MKRSTAICMLRSAGYHDDSSAFTKLYIENRISMESAQRAWREGKAAKANGVRCTCSGCTEELLNVYPIGEANDS